MSLEALLQSVCERCEAEMYPWQTAGPDSRVCINCLAWTRPQLPLDVVAPHRPVVHARLQELPKEPELPESENPWDLIRQGDVPYPRR